MNPTDSWALDPLAAWSPRIDALPAPSLQLAHRTGHADRHLLDGDQAYLSTVAEFVGFLYASGWMIPGFDWGAWQRTAEAKRLWTEGDALETATPEQLAKVLTTLVRQDRFVDGTIDAAIADRTLHRVLARATRLADDAR